MQRVISEYFGIIVNFVRYDNGIVIIFIKIYLRNA